MGRLQNAELANEYRTVSIDVNRTSTEDGSTHLGQVSERLYIDPVAEKSYVRKLDMCLLPVLAIMYFCRYTTGSNIGNAKTNGMDKQLGLKGEEYSIMMTVINIPFVLLEPVQTMMLVRTKDHRGIVSLCQATVKNYAGILVCRLLIACFQSGFFSGCIFYLTLFYKRDELAFRTAVFYGTATIAGAFTGLISYGVF
ncbi:hypothetical protein N0V90_000172 [Kalmusia sp. IMI 367209]|nr:hypothetical protein N0V90_000172 [Kalmusia sp. IMI 367209]